jgi:O-acetylhomoserine (thiol)-lyase
MVIARLVAILAPVAPILAAVPAIFPAIPTVSAPIAQFLRDHPAVSYVNYPSLPGDQYHALAKKYLPKGASAVLTFGIKGGLDAGIKFIEGVQFLSHLANIGDAKSLVIHPASTTHRQMSEDEQIAAGIRPDMIRLSVGLETLADILWDLDQALANATHS